MTRKALLSGVTDTQCSGLSYWWGGSFHEEERAIHPCLQKSTENHSLLTTCVQLLQWLEDSCYPRHNIHSVFLQFHTGFITEDEVCDMSSSSSSSFLLHFVRFRVKPLMEDSDNSDCWNSLVSGGSWSQTFLWFTQHIVHWLVGSQGSYLCIYNLYSRCHTSIWLILLKVELVLNSSHKFRFMKPRTELRFYCSSVFFLLLLREEAALQQPGNKLSYRKETWCISSHLSSYFIVVIAVVH